MPPTADKTTTEDLVMNILNSLEMYYLFNMIIKQKKKGKKDKIRKITDKER